MTDLKHPRAIPDVSCMPAAQHSTAQHTCVDATTSTRSGSDSACSKSSPHFRPSVNSRCSGGTDAGAGSALLYVGSPAAPSCQAEATAEGTMHTLCCLAVLFCFSFSTAMHCTALYCAVGDPAATNPASLGRVCTSRQPACRRAVWVDGKASPCHLQYNFHHS